jgi:phage baseplate assembly protein W
METAISLPFSVDPYGSITSTVDQAKIWADRVRSVIGTNLNERVMLPTFGTLVPSAFMETVDAADSLISSEIRTAFANQLPLLTFEKADITYDEYSNTVNISIVYDLPNNQETATTTIALITIDGNSPASEENL